jgi:hypothetical protein
VTAMKTCLVTALLMLIAVPASADHVWRLWCGHPPIKRGALETAEACWNVVMTIAQDVAACVDTPDGPVRSGYKQYPHLWDIRGYRTCAEVRREEENCTCEPEAVPEK